MIYPMLVYMMMLGMGYDLGHCTYTTEQVNGYAAPAMYCVAEPEAPEPEPEREKTIKEEEPERKTYTSQWSNWRTWN